MQLNSTYLIGIIQQVKIYFSNDGNKIVRINLKVPHDIHNLSEDNTGYSWFNVSYFNVTQELLVNDWVLIAGGRLSKSKYQKDGVTRYSEQISCNDNNFFNLTNLVQKNVPQDEKGHKYEAVLNEIKSKFQEGYQPEEDEQK